MAWGMPRCRVRVSGIPWIHSRMGHRRFAEADISGRCDRWVLLSCAFHTSHSGRVEGTTVEGGGDSPSAETIRARGHTRLGQGRVGCGRHRPMEDGQVLMKIKKKKKKPDVEYPSSIICKSFKGVRVYWTGSKWTHKMERGKSYLRAIAMKKARKKKSFVITTGFYNR